MSNSEENYESNNNINVNDPDEEQSETSEQSGDAASQGIDTEHNTGNKRMRIDEEGAEIGPDDEV
jgi:hypothetical protein